MKRRSWRGPERESIHRKRLHLRGAAGGEKSERGVETIPAYRRNYALLFLSTHTHYCTYTVVCIETCITEYLDICMYSVDRRGDPRKLIVDFSLEPNGWEQQAQRMLGQRSTFNFS